MTIMVTFRRGKRMSRRNYKTFDNAVRGIRCWFEKNQGMVIVYQPEKDPVVYSCQSQLPESFLKKETSFYRTKAWRDLRFEMLVEPDAACALCLRNRTHGVVLHVDHIKPRSKFPELALEKSNLQILCEDCNMAKADNELVIK